MIGDRWGVTADETARPYPCDSFVAEPTVRVWRGVTVDAPAAAVSVGDLVMARRQLLNLKHLAEQQQPAGGVPESR